MVERYRLGVLATSFKRDGVPDRDRTGRGSGLSSGSESGSQRTATSDGDTLGVNMVAAMDLRYVSGLTEGDHSQRPDPGSQSTANPAERVWMPVDDSDHRDVPLIGRDQLAQKPETITLPFHRTTAIKINTRLRIPGLKDSDRFDQI